MRKPSSIVNIERELEKFFLEETEQNKLKPAYIADEENKTIQRYL